MSRPLIAVDFDGTIVDHKYPAIGALKPGVIEALTRFRALGFELIIFSCRGCKWYPELFPPEQIARCFAEMKAFLDANQVPYDLIDDGSKGKPFADYYIDDKAIRFQDNWSAIALAIEVEAIGLGRLEQQIFTTQKSKGTTA